MIREVFLVNTSHVDITWWNTPGRCHERIIKVMRQALDFAEEDPAFRFSIESVYPVYVFLLERPGEAGRLRSLVESGRIDIGGEYVSPVSDYCSDELLYRNFLFGKKWLLENTGIDTPLAREEDSPGHTMQTPQLCRGFGMKYMRFSRGPLGLFRWRAPDGSDVLTFTASYSWAFSPRLGKSLREKLSTGLPKRLDYAKSRKYEFDVLMLPDGDDNALPNKDAPFLAAEWNRRNHKLRFRMATMIDFFERADKFTLPSRIGDIPNQWAQIAIFQPEAFDEARALRAILPMSELAGGLLSAVGNMPDNSKLDKVWRTYLECMDHNWGGREQGEFGLECDLHKLESLKTAMKDADKITSFSLNAFCKSLPSMPDAETFAVFNPLSCARTGPVEVSLACHSRISPEAFLVTDDEGNECNCQAKPHQANGTGFIFEARNVPSCGYKTFYVRPTNRSACKGASITNPANMIENSYYRIETLENGGGIKSIYDKELGCELIPETGGRLLDIFGVKLHFNEVWALGLRFDPAPKGFYDDPENEGKVGESISLSGGIIAAGECEGSRHSFEDGPVYSSLKSTVKFIGNSRIEQQIILYHGVKQIDLKTTIVWDGAENYLINLSLPFGPADGTMTMDVPFGTHAFGNEVPGFWGTVGGPNSTIQNVAATLPRSAKKWLRNNFFDDSNKVMNYVKSALASIMMKEDSTVSRGIYNWLDISDSKWGTTLIVRHAPFDFSFGTNASLFASLKKSAFFNGEHYLHKGIHEFKYTLTSHAADWRSANVQQWGRAASAPLCAYTAEGGDGALPPVASLVSCDSPNIVFTSVRAGEKPGEIIARFYESLGMKTSVRLNSTFNIQSAALCDMMEHETEPLPIENSKAVVELAPYKIMTVRLMLAIKSVTAIS